MNIAEIRKAIVAITGAVAAIVILWFPELDGTVEKALITVDLVLTTLAVYQVPNAPEAPFEDDLNWSEIEKPGVQ